MYQVGSWVLWVVWSNHLNNICLSLWKTYLTSGPCKFSLFHKGNLWVMDVGCSFVRDSVGYFEAFETMLEAAIFLGLSQELAFSDVTIYITNHNRRSIPGTYPASNLDPGLRTPFKWVMVVQGSKYELLPFLEPPLWMLSHCACWELPCCCGDTNFLQLASNWPAHPVTILCLHKKKPNAFFGLSLAFVMSIECSKKQKETDKT